MTDADTLCHQEDPDTRYTFDSERDAPQSEICREGRDKAHTCITVRPRPLLTPSIQCRY